MLLLHFGTRACLFSPDKGSCYVFSTRNNCCEFLASDGVIFQSVIKPFLKTPVFGAPLTSLETVFVFDSEVFVWFHSYLETDKQKLWNEQYFIFNKKCLNSLYILVADIVVLISLVRMIAFFNIVSSQHFKSDNKKTWSHPLCCAITSYKKILEYQKYK